jgi:Ca-activated chloride channel family protein
MSFSSPGMFAALLLVPAMIAGYVLLQRRRAQRLAELAQQALVPMAPARYGRRRHVPFVLFCLAAVTLLVGLARPHVNLTLPHREGTVVLAFDVSNSMLATDLQPTRLDAAKVAAKKFVERQPSSIKIGVVAFSDGGFTTQAPTDVKGDVDAAIDRLTPQGGTSLAAGMFTSLNMIAGKPIALTPEQLAGNLDSVNIGYFGSAAVILLSDGENTARTDPQEVAKLASVAGVRIYPIGIGSAQGTTVKINGFNVATALDEQQLTDIATVTNGKYFNAQDAASLASIYGSIKLQFVNRGGQTEVTGLFAGAGALLLVVGGALSLLWFGRVV